MAYGLLGDSGSDKGDASNVDPHHPQSRNWLASLAIIEGISMDCTPCGLLGLPTELLVQVFMSMPWNSVLLCSSVPLFLP